MFDRFLEIDDNKYYINHFLEAKHLAPIPNNPLRRDIPVFGVSFVQVVGT